jgi:hypothetical protein
MSGDEDVLADWSMPEPLDAPQVFFVRHADRIRRWSELEKDVQARALVFLTDLAEEVQRRDMVPGLDDDEAALNVRSGDEWAGVGLSRAHWREMGVSVRLEWWARRVGFDSSVAPYVGVRLHEASFEDQRTRRIFKERLGPYRSGTSSGFTKRWPTWRRVPIDPALVRPEGVDLSGYRLQLLGALVNEWHAVASIVDEIIADVGAQGLTTR